MYKSLVDSSLKTGTIGHSELKWILSDPEVDLLSLLKAAYQVRSRHFSNNVKIHILHNVQSGACSEDCKYCAQSSHSKSDVEVYPMKSDEEILAAAEQAYKSGAYRHCMVFSGRELKQKRIERICHIVEKIRYQYPMEICVSAGFLNGEDAGQLKTAGVDRYNHNLNTSAEYYNEICSTHSFEERIKTINTAKEAGMDVCSGVIIGMGETDDDIVHMTDQLKRVEAASIPVNFFIPVEGHRISDYRTLTPDFCLRVLCAFRLAIPETEIRAAGGREYHLRSMQALCLYAVNSVFAKGYLTTGGDDIQSIKQMILDAGFVVEAIEE